MLFDRIPKSNLHTHTCFCDGKNTPEEMIRAAVEAGMDTLGFSGHSALSFENDWSMTEAGTAAYCKEILRLKSLWADRISVLLGIEQDFDSAMPPIGYEYVIGSVHHVVADGEYLPIDLSCEALLEGVKKHFGGDFFSLTRQYYERMAELPKRTGCDIVGHFDLVTKFNEGGLLFDERDPRYLRPALDALDALLEKDVIFEINTGAISRGYRRTPYPAPVFLHRIAEKRGNVTLTSDAHSKDRLLAYFPEALQFARAAGLGAVVIMTKEGWKHCPL